MVAMRLTRIGARKRPYYRIIVIDKRRARNGRFLEIIGHYDPLADPPKIELNQERARHWLSRGAQPSDTVRAILLRKKVVS